MDHPQKLGRNSTPISQLSDIADFTSEKRISKSIHHRDLKNMIASFAIDWLVLEVSLVRGDGHRFYRNRSEGHEHEQEQNEPIY